MIHDLPKSLVEDSKKILKMSKEYEDFFKATLKKFGVTSPAELSNDKKKEFFDYIDKNYKGEKEEQVEEGTCDSSKKKKYEYVELDEANVSFVFHDKAEAKLFASKVKGFVDNVELIKYSTVGQVHVKLTGSKEGFKKAVAVAVKMSGE
tara:strand:- start:278 stop:724 length:447 start_codon:yes stop_codon:yes gene_type:complete